MILGDSVFGQGRRGTECPHSQLLHQLLGALPSQQFVIRMPQSRACTGKGTHGAPCSEPQENTESGKPGSTPGWISHHVTLPLKIRAPQPSWHPPSSPKPRRDVASVAQEIPCDRREHRDWKPPGKTRWGRCEEGKGGQEGRCESLQVLSVLRVNLWLRQV